MRTLQPTATRTQANRPITQSDVDAAPLPANYLAAVAAMAALDRETRRRAVGRCLPIRLKSKRNERCGWR